MRRHGIGPIVVMAALLALFAVVLIYPIWLTIRGGFETADGGFTLGHVRQVVMDPVLRRGLVNAFAIAACTTVLSLILAAPLAILSARFEFPARRVLSAMILLPLILPPFVGAIGVQHLLGRYGAVNTLLVQLGVLDNGIDFIGRGGFWAVVVMEALHLFPIIHLNLTASLANLDPVLEHAAENLGANRRQRLLSIVLPQVRPGLFAGGTIVFIWSLTELGTPLVVGYDRVTPVQIFHGINAMTVSHQPWALTAIMLAAAVLSYALGRFVFARGAAAASTAASTPATPTLLRGVKAAAAIGLFGLVFAAAGLPHAGVVLTSFTEVGHWYQSVLPSDVTVDHYINAAGHPLAVGSIRNSLVYASIAAALDLGVGLLIAYLIVRTTVPGRRLLDSLAMLPLAVPGLVIAFGYVAMSLRWPFGSGDPLEGVVDVIGAEPNPVPLLVIAYAVRRLPYVVRSAVAGLEQTPVRLEEAAVNLGARRLAAVGTIVVPLIAASLIAGGLLAFSFAMLEVSDSLILAQREGHFPVTKAIYVLFERLGDGPHLASAMGVWAMALLGLTLVAASILLGRRIGAMFRV